MNGRTALVDHAMECLEALTAFPDRHVGGPGNRAATALFAEAVQPWGFRVTCTQFECIEWDYGTAELDTGDERFELNVGPYSLPCGFSAPLIRVSSAEELDDARVKGAIVLLHGEIARGQLMPKNFTFYNPESHQLVYRLIEKREPAALIGATGTDPQLVGGQYPFPLFEDGDLDVPNAYMKDVDGERLAAHEGREVTVRIDSRRVPTTAEHVVAIKPGSDPGRIVVFAHIDSRKGSPGALDNASGTASLLCLAELLADYERGPSIEIVALNGEDNYANPGELLWMAENEGRADDILLGINVDDAGWRGHDTHVSLYDCPEAIVTLVEAAMARRPGFARGPEWFQGDHMLFRLLGRPSVALASSGMREFMERFAHTEGDRLELADPGIVVDVAFFMRELVDLVGE